MAEALNIHLSPEAATEIQTELVRLGVKAEKYAGVLMYHINPLSGIFHTSKHRSAIQLVIANPEVEGKEVPEFAPTVAE